MQSETTGEPKHPVQRSRVVDAVERRGIYYGWVVVAVCFVGQTITGISLQGMSTFVVPLQREFGWSQTTIGLGRAFQQLDSAIGPFNGSLVDRVGTRVTFIAGLTLYGVTFLTFASIGDIWGFYGISALLALSNSLCGLLVVSVVANHWFRRRRTTALGLSVMGLAFSGMAIAPLLVWAQSLLGWRNAALATGAAVLLIGVPMALLMRSTPERHGLLPDGEHRPAAAAATAAPGRMRATPPEVFSFTLRETLRTRAFWFATLAAGLAAMAINATTVYQFAHLELTFSRELAAIVLIVMNVFSITGRILGGYLGDRFPKHIVLGVAVFGSAASLLLLALGTHPALTFVYGALFGLAWGIRTPVAGSLLGEFFGRNAFGRIAGTSQTLAAPFGLGGPILAGIVSDAQGSYQGAFLMLSAVFLLSAILFYVSRAPAPPHRASL